MKIVACKITLFAFLTLVMSTVYAADLNIGVFDSILKSFYTTGQNWYPILSRWAKWIFWTSSGLEFMFIVGYKKMFAGQLDKLFIVMMSRVIVAGLLFDLFVSNMDLYLGVIKWFVNISADLGGQVKQPTDVIFSVSGLFGDMWVSVRKPFKAILVMTIPAGAVSIPIGIFFLSMLLSIILAILVSCVTVLWFLCKSWLILFGGFFMTGFIGSNWTRNYWQSYLKAAVGVALQLFMLSLAVLIVGTQWKNPDLWLPKFEFDMSSITAAAASVAGLVITLFERLIATLGVLFFDMVLLIGAPSLGASLASGTINAGLGELIGAASGVLSGGFMMGKAAQAGATAVGQVAKAVGGAGDVAKSATRSSYRESLKNGISGGEGTDGNFKEMAKQQARGAGQDAKANHMKSGISDAGGAFKGSMNEVGKKGSSVASNLSRGSGGGGASAPSVNTNTPHQ